MNRALLVAVLALAVAGCPRSTPTGARTAPTPQSEEEKVIYALGMSIGRSIQPFQLNAEELELVKAGLESQVLAKEPAVNLEEYGPKLQELSQQRMKQHAERQKEKGQAYLEEAAKEEGAVRTESGMVFKQLEPGEGPSPTPADTVRVHYKGTLIDGKEFDSSHRRGQPATFPLGGVIRCWTEGVQLMKAGGKARLVCPPELAYGERGAGPDIPGGSTLIFEVELLEIVQAPPTPE